MLLDLDLAHQDWNGRVFWFEKEKTRFRLGTADS